MNRFFRGEISDAVIVSLPEDYQTEKLDSKTEVIIEKMISDLLNPSHKPLHRVEQTILLYDNRSKLKSVLSMENYNELISVGTNNSEEYLYNTQWLCSFMEQTYLFKDNSGAFYAMETNTEEFCHYIDVTNKS